MLSRSFLPALEFSESLRSVSSSLPPAAATLTKRQEVLFGVYPSLSCCTWSPCPLRQGVKMPVGKAPREREGKTESLKL